MRRSVDLWTGGGGEAQKAKVWAIQKFVDFEPQIENACSIFETKVLSVHDIVRQVRDITSNTEWERAYQYEIPVLAKQNSDGKEEIIPRLSPSLSVESVEIIQKKLLAGKGNAVRQAQGA